MEKAACPCGSGILFNLCCEPYIKHNVLPVSAEALMRSRYTAYTLADAKYIIETTHPSKRYLHSKREILAWAKENEWLGLSILFSSFKEVKFQAVFKDRDGEICKHIELSTFSALGGKWYYVDGQFFEDE